MCSGSWCPGLTGVCLPWTHVPTQGEPDGVKKNKTDSCCEELTGAETQHGGTQPCRNPEPSFLTWLFHNCPASSWGRLGQFNIVKSSDVTRPPLRMWSYSTERNSVIAWGWSIEGPQIQVPVYFVWPALDSITTYGWGGRKLKTTFVGHLESQGVISQLESMFKYFLTSLYKSADEGTMTSATFFVLFL